jgi:hypothetical protein
MIAMLAIIYFASDIGRKAAPNASVTPETQKAPSPSIGGMSKAPDTLPEIKAIPASVPTSLEDARQKAKDRLIELQALNQKQWDAEREKVLYRHPPERIEEAIGRAMLRVKDLEEMDEAGWEADKLRIIRRERYIEEQKAAPKISEDDLRKEIGTMFNKQSLGGIPFEAAQ